MKNKRSRIIAWGLAGAAIISSLVYTGLWAAGLNETPTLFDGVEAFGWGLALPIVFSILAAMIIAKQPSNRVGWLMMVIALAAINPLAQDLPQFKAPPETVSIGTWLLIWLTGWSWLAVIFPIFLIPLYFPTGDLPSPRWKWVPRMAIGLGIIFMILLLIIEEAGPINADWVVKNPLSGGIPNDLIEGPFLFFWGGGLMTTISASVVSLFIRFRRSASTERQQIRWLLFTGTLFLLVYGSAFYREEWGESGWQNLIFILSILGLPTAIALAIFRYRLWDLDVVINRALIYGPLSALLAGTFALAITMTSELTKEALGEQSKALGAAVSAVLVAMVFQPLREKIEAFVDKRFYPRKMDLASGLVEIEPAYWGFLNRQTLIQLSMEHVCNVLGTQHAAFYLESGADRFRMAGQVNGTAQPGGTLTISKKQHEELKKKRVITSEVEGPIRGHIPVFVDRGVSHEILGLLSIGARTNGKGYSGDDLKGMVQLGNKIGLALRAIQLGEIS